MALHIRQNFALDDVKHLLPDCTGHLPEAILAIGARASVENVGGGGREPDLEELFWALEGRLGGVGGVGVGHSVGGAIWDGRSMGHSGRRRQACKAVDGGGEERGVPSKMRHHIDPAFANRTHHVT